MDTIYKSADDFEEGKYGELGRGAHNQSRLAGSRPSALGGLSLRGGGRFDAFGNAGASSTVQQVERVGVARQG